MRENEVTNMIYKSAMNVVSVRGQSHKIGRQSVGIHGREGWETEGYSAARLECVSDYSLEGAP